MMNFLVFEFRTNHEACFAISNFLQANGALGISITAKQEFLQSLEDYSTPDTIASEFIENLSDEVLIEAYFKGFDDQVEINQEIALVDDNDTVSKIWISINDFEDQLRDGLKRIQEISTIGLGYLGYKIIVEEDWSENWKQYYETLKIGSIVINPSWIDYQAKPDEVVLNLDPGSTFGTGSHESTSLVLECLANFHFKNMPKGRILDLGTGSGILAIAAAKIFPNRDVAAIDIEEHAVNVAKKNALKNEADIFFSVGELEDTKEQYSLILANLVASIHMDLAEKYLDRLLPEGFLLISGIIESKAKEVRSKFDSVGLEIIDKLSRNDWHLFLYKKKTAFKK